MKKMLEPIVFFGNEKLATGLENVQPLIKNALEKAGYVIEKHLTGPLSQLGENKSRLAVLAAYGHIIPKSVLDRFPLGIINVHPSLLPIYRGPTPIEQAILDNAKETGVSIMRLSSHMDEGPIYTQKSIKLRGKETKAELSLTLQALGAQLILEVLPRILSSDLEPNEQGPNPTYTKKLTKADGVIDWHKPSETIQREIRAYRGWPGSFTKLGDTQVIVTEAKPVGSSGPTGKIIIDAKKIVVYCGQGALEIQRLKPAGKREMLASEFLAGYRNRLEIRLAGS